MSTESDGGDRGESATPFFVTCGADSLIKIWEHNLYRIKESDNSKGKKAIRMVSDEWRKKVTEADQSAKAQIIQDAFEKEGTILEIFGSLFYKKVILKLAEVKDGSPVLDLDKLVAD